MSEWSTYTLADLLMFSSRSYYRLIALYNEAIWPAHLLAIAAGLGLLVCIARPGVRTHRIAMLVLAAAWGWVAWAYQLQRYADINTAAPWFAFAFGVQAVLLCFGARRSRATAAAGLQRRVALGLATVGLIACPLLAPATGRGWGTAEVFGIAPDPTAVATLGWLLACRAHPLAWVVPLAWCAVSGATLMELHIGHAWVLPACAILALAAHLFLKQSTQSSAH